jgi:hypothetical protein
MVDNNRTPGSRSTPADSRDRKQPRLNFIGTQSHSGPVSNSGREENTPPSSGQPAETTVRAGSVFEVDGSESPQFTSLLQK